MLALIIDLYPVDISFLQVPLSPLPPIVSPPRVRPTTLCLQLLLLKIFPSQVPPSPSSLCSLGSTRRCRSLDRSSLRLSSNGTLLSTPKFFHSASPSDSAHLSSSFPTRSVLSSAVLIFGLTTVLFLAIDAGTGGLPRTRSKGHKVHYGSWNPNALFPLYCLSGIAYGMVELIRRVIPRVGLACLLVP